MAITTTDVITSAVTTTDTIEHGTIVVSVSPTFGSFKFSNEHVINTPLHTGVQNKYTNRFDDVGYDSLGSGISGGGA